MKKNLKVTGKVLFERHDFIKMITEVLQATEDLQLERIIPVDKQGNAIELDSLICYVHQTKSEEIPDKYDPAKTIDMPKGIARPNYGVGRMIHESLEVGEVYDVNELLKELKDKYPKLDKKVLKRYLKRPEMVGAQVEFDGDQFIVNNLKKK